jgi:hypothetical protein
LDEATDYGENTVSGNYKVTTDSNGSYHVTH